MPLIAISFSAVEGEEEDDFEPVEFGGWSTPCWACGRMVRQTNGYNRITETSNTWLVADSPQHAEQLLELLRYLEALDPQTPPSAVADEIESRVPWLRPVADWLRANKTDVQFAAGVAISLLLWLVPSPFASHDNPPSPPANITKSDLDRLANEIERLRSQQATHDADPEQRQQGGRGPQPPRSYQEGGDGQSEPETDQEPRPR